MSTAYYVKCDGCGKVAEKKTTGWLTTAGATTYYGGGDATTTMVAGDFCSGKCFLKKLGAATK